MLHDILRTFPRNNKLKISMLWTPNILVNKMVSKIPKILRYILRGVNTRFFQASIATVTGSPKVTASELAFRTYFIIDFDFF